MKPSEYIRQGWCRGKFAIESHGLSVEPHKVEAIAWCVIGAAKAAYHKDFSGFTSVLGRLQYLEAIKECPQTTIECRIAYWNDFVAGTQQEVIDLLESIGE